jgi:nicotinamide-nucleotide adenylyltransferase
MLTGLFIGRFQPLHYGHIETIKSVLKTVDFLIIIVGSAQNSHELRNPFTAGERIQMIRNTLIKIKEIDISKILIIPVSDTQVHALWTYNIDLLVPKYDLVFTNDPFTIVLYKERGIKTIQPELHHRKKFSGTLIRDYIIKDGDWKQLVHPETTKIIQDINGIDRLKKIWRKHKELFDIT